MESDDEEKPTKSLGIADDLVSVTVRKPDPTQKAGIMLVEREGALYISKLLKGGLFQGSEIEAGDKILSLNGHRLKRGVNASNFMNSLTQTDDMVTVVVKKANMSPTRAARSMSPRAERRRRKLMKEEGGLSNDSEDHDQYRFRAEKLYSKQPGGLMFKKINRNLYVSGIALDSIFKNTGLDVGDRIVSVNEVNFLSYADDKYAATLLQRGEGEVSLVVEKGWSSFDREVDTDKNHEKPFVEPQKTKPSNDEGIKLPRRRSSGGSSEVSQGLVNKSLSRNRRRSAGAESIISSTKPDHSTNSRKKDREAANDASSHGDGKGPNGLRFLEHKGDFLCITIKKKSEKHCGIKIRESRGIFLLKKVPSYEKRVGLGSRILAINGSSFTTEEEAQELIDRTKVKTVLIIDFEQPVLQECPSCGIWLTPNGEKYKE